MYWFIEYIKSKKVMEEEKIFVETQDSYYPLKEIDNNDA